MFNKKVEQIYEIVALDESHYMLKRYVKTSRFFRKPKISKVEFLRTPYSFNLQVGKTVLDLNKHEDCLTYCELNNFKENDYWTSSINSIIDDCVFENTTFITVKLKQYQTIQKLIMDHIPENMKNNEYKY